MHRERLRTMFIEFKCFLTFLFSPQNFFVHQEITSKLTRLQSQLNSFIRKSPEQLEKFLLENSKHIHSDHLMMVEVKYIICLMYGNVVGFQFKGLIFSIHWIDCMHLFEFLSLKIFQGSFWKEKLNFVKMFWGFTIKLIRARQAKEPMLCLNCIVQQLYKQNIN